MVAWLADHFDWNGRTSRDEYRRWLPLIIAFELALLWSLAAFGRNGRLHFEDFGPWGAALFLLGVLYMIGWTLLTARRRRSAGITRRWLLLALFVNIPIADTFVTISLVVTLILIAVATLAPDRDTITAI